MIVLPALLLSCHTDDSIAVTTSSVCDLTDEALRKHRVQNQTFQDQIETNLTSTAIESLHIKEFYG